MLKPYICFLSIILLSLNLFSQTTDTLTIYFDLNKYKIKEQYNSMLLQLKDSNIIDIKITAYCDFLGTDTYNNHLSQLRANEAFNALMQYNISKTIVSECKGLGKYISSSVQSNSSLGIAEHRKANIIFTYKPIDKAKEDKIKFVFSDNTNPISDSISHVSTSINSIKNYEDINIGMNIELPNIYFEGGTALVRYESIEALKDLLFFLTKYSTLKVEIEGHICCQDSNSLEDGYDNINHNNKLSENRAKAIYEYLISRGIDSSRLSYKAYGATRKKYPLEQNEIEKQANRRVEIKIIDK